MNEEPPALSYKRLAKQRITMILALLVTLMQAHAPLAVSELELTVVASETAFKRFPETVWLGLQNRTPDARLVCILSRGAWPKVPEGGSRMVAEGFSPHECDSEASYTLVLPSQTAYLPWSIPSSLNASVNQVLVIKVEVASRVFTGGERRATSLEWTGTAADMSVAGKALGAKH